MSQIRFWTVQIIFTCAPTGKPQIIFKLTFTVTYTPDTVKTLKKDP